MIKTSKKLISALLVLCMVIAMLPMGAVAADSKATSDSVTLDYGIVHLDCGRKYFSVESIKAIIDATAEAGMNYVQLAIGNDGLRFLLDDMELTVDNTTYDSDAVRNAIRAGNEAYYNFTVDELSQAEMDEIIDYAKTVGVGIIPLINTPGHMDAILDAGESLTGQTLSYNGSARTIDVTNNLAVEFTQKLLKLYIDYFAGKGCTIFNMGADEYANDIYSSGGMGFGQLQTNGQYGRFVEYVNEVADMVSKAGMTPMAFNDGFYYASNTSYGTFNSDIVIQYWSSGWGGTTGYNVASASFLQGKGHKLVNAHGDYYWVLGKSDWQCSASKAAGFNYQSFQGGTIEAPAGVAFLIWCDYPGAGTEASVVSATTPVIKAFNHPAIAAAKWNGDQVTEPETPKDVTIQNEATNTSVTVPGLTELVVTPVEMPAKEGAMGYDFQPKTADGAYTGKGMVSIPVPQGWDTNRIRGYIVNKDGSISDNLMGAVEDGKFLLEVPHFSEIGIYEAAADAPGKTEDVFFTYGDGNKTITISGNNYENSVNSAALDTSIATVVVTGKDGQEGGYSYSEVTPNCNNIVSESSWTKTNYYYLKDGTYYPFYAKVSTDRSLSRTTYTYTWGYLPDGASTPEECGTQEYSVEWFGSHKAIDVNIYERTGTDATPASTTIVITPVGVGTTSVVVGDTQYNITVNAKEETKNVFLNLTGTTTHEMVGAGTGESVQYNVTQGQDIVSVEGKVITAEAIGNATVVATVTKNGVTVATYTYHVTVSDAAPDGAMTGDTLSVEMWITNSMVWSQSSGGVSSYTINKTEANTPDGIAITSKVPEIGWGRFDGPIELHYWKTVRLDSDHQQVDNGQDRTADGTSLTHVRYFNSAWQYKTADGQWHYFASGDQVAAFYMRHTQLTQDVTTAVKDWGYTIDSTGDTPDTSSGQGQAALMVGVVYPDGTMEPAEGELLLKSTNIFNYDANWKGSGHARSIGIVAPIINEDYNISKITYVRGTRTNDTSSNYWNSDATVEWKKVSINGKEYYDEIEAWDKSSGTEPMINGDAQEIYFEGKNTAVLVLIYLEPVIKDTNLTVEYYDVTNGRPIGSYQVVMGGENHSFRLDLKGNTAAIPTDESVFALADEAYVTNKFGNNQTFSKDLMNAGFTDMEEVYRSGMYGYENAQILDDGMTLRLNYILKEGVVTDPTYVVDFGLKVHFPLSDVIAPPSTYQGSFENYVRQYVESVTLYSNASYGDITISDDILTITYTPTRILGNLDIAMLRINMADNKTIIAQVGFLPATTVYYEEGFATFGTGWNVDAGGSWRGNTNLSAYTWHQNVVKYTKDNGGHLYASKEESNYGYDQVYLTDKGTSATTNAKNDSLKFTFRGTGIDIFANCVQGSGNIGVRITDAEGATVKLAAIDLSYDGEYAQTGNAYATPVLSILSLPYGEYEVTIVKTSETGDFTFDGFRVYNTVNPSTSEDETSQTYHAYDSVGEAHPYFFDLRDQVIGAIGLGEYQGKYADQLASLYSQVYNPTGDANNVVFFDLNAPSVTSENLINLLENGPKNELYLAPGQAVTFKLEATSAQIGLRSVGGTEVTYKIGDETYTLSHSVDMFYEIPVGQAVTIQNVSGGVLSIGDVKVFGITTAEPAMAFAALTEEDFGVALMCLGFEESFQPEISMKWLVDSVKVGVRAVLQITTGTDVESLTVNGQALRYVELRGVRIWTYTVRNNQAGTYTYDVVAMNADGVAAEAVQTPVLTVTRSVLLAFLERFFG